MKTLILKVNSFKNSKKWKDKPLNWKSTLIGFVKKKLNL